jgi:hypothetical protein
MKLHINTLFRCNSDGRLLQTNESGDWPAPRFYMGRTQKGNVWRFRHDLPADITREVGRLCRLEPIAADLAHPPRHYEAIRSVLREHAPIGSEYRGPAFAVPSGIPVSANTTLISSTNAALLQEGFPWLLKQVAESSNAPLAVAVTDGMAVSACFCSRIPGLATEAGVETLAVFRGQGHATAAVAGWAEEVWRRECIPLYSTSWDNLASQSVARKLGMVRYGEGWSIE